MTTQPRRLGKYELRERLARGGQGEVWKAYDLQLQRFVAIKQLNANLQDDSDFIARFEREAQLIASLHHPNIVRIHDFQFLTDADSQKPTAYMIMEYIEGSTLADYIRSSSRKRLFPSPSTLLTIFTAVSLALDYAHRRGMLHRDIKPANIMLDIRNPDDGPLGKPVLMDFGIAKLQGGSDTTKVLGTPLYVSPEQARGQIGSSASDLYSLGIVLYEMTTGVTPFRGETLMELLMRHFNDTPTPPILINPALPQAVSDVILKSIAKEPGERFPSASAMTLALAKAFDVPAPPELLRSTSLPGIAGYGIHNPISLPGNIADNTVVSFETHPVESPVAALPLTPQPMHSPIVKVEQGSISTTEPPTVELDSKPDFVLKGPRKRLYLGLSVALLLVLGIGIIGYELLSMRQLGTVPPATSTRAGQVLFLMSPNAPGVFDQAQITLPGLKDPPNGKSYYAWLATHDDSMEAVHWQLTLHNGKPVPTNYINPQHQNLLAQSSYLFLITVQGSDTAVASFDPNDLLYYASIPQMPASTDHYSVIDHLNHLLTKDPSLEKIGLSNGLRYWLMMNTQAIIQEVSAANVARRDQQTRELRQHLVNILYYLRGTTCASTDLRTMPQGTPTTPDKAIEQQVKVSLLECMQNSVLSSLLAHTELHVRGIVQAPGATPTQAALAPQLQTNLAQVRQWLGQLYQQDIMHLLALSDNDLLQSSAQPYFDDMRKVSNEVYNGQTSNSKLGMHQMNTDLQHLATFDILPCPKATKSVCTS